MRDKTLDYLRALSMIYITCVIHTLFWWVPNQTIAKGFFLVEMFVIFFIIGASLRLSRDKKYFDYLIDKIIRIVIPYIIFSFICILIMMIFNNIRPFGKFNDNLLTIIISWINIFNVKDIYGNYAIGNINFIYWHTWFIPVYIVLMFFIILIKKINQKQLTILFIVNLLIIFLINIFDFNMNGLGLVAYNSIFYLNFIIMGYNKEFIESNKYISSLMIVIGLISIYILTKYFNYSVDMSVNKFPPNLLFYSYGLVIIGLIVKIYHSIIKLSRYVCIDRLLNYWAKYNYTAYLYHSLSHVILFIIYTYSNVFIIVKFKGVGLFLHMILVFIITSCLMKIFGNIELLKHNKKKK